MNLLFVCRSPYYLTYSCMRFLCVFIYFLLLFLPSSVGLSVFLFENGQCKEYVTEDLPNGIPDGKHPGTTVSYKSSEKYMHTTEHDIPRICDLCNNIAYQTPGFTFNFTVDGKVHTFRHLNPLKEQMILLIYQ